MYRMIDFFQKPKSKENSCPSTLIEVNEAEVKRIMGKDYLHFVESRNKIYEAIE